MPKGNAPDTASAALLLIDVINPLDFDGAEAMLDRAEAAAERIAAFKSRWKEAGLPVVYCNDHFGQWQENFERVVERCTDEEVPGHRVARTLRPEPDDYFILKPMHSAFFQTTLEILLDRIGASALVLCGFSGDVCVLASAIDAYMRDYRVVIPADGIASVNPEEDAHTLAYARRVFEAETPALADLDPAALAEHSEEG